MTLKQAFKANAATFYDARTGRRYSLTTRYALIGVIAIVAVLLRLELPRDALSALITVLGVMLGFGYSVQFYIAGTMIPADSIEDALEDVGDKRVLRKLSSEIYDNVSYLNRVIFFAILPPFSLLIPTPEIIAKRADWAAATMNQIGLILLWYISIEVAATFYRVLMRASQYFGERRRLQG